MEPWALIRCDSIAIIIILFCMYILQTKLLIHHVIFGFGMCGKVIVA